MQKLIVLLPSNRGIFVFLSMNSSSLQLNVSWKERTSSDIPVNLSLIFFTSSSKYLSWSVKSKSVLICYTTLYAWHSSTRPTQDPQVICEHGKESFVTPLKIIAQYFILEHLKRRDKCIKSLLFIFYPANGKLVYWVKKGQHRGLPAIQPFALFVQKSQGPAVALNSLKS